MARQVLAYRLSFELAVVLDVSVLVGCGSIEGRPDVAVGIFSS